MDYNGARSRYILTLATMRGINNIKELAEWVKYNRLINISGIGDLKEKKILIQLDDFMRQRRKEEQESKSK